MWFLDLLKKLNATIRHEENVFISCCPIAFAMTNKNAHGHCSVMAYFDHKQ